jgi:hypothetical protein
VKVSTKGRGLPKSGKPCPFAFARKKNPVAITCFLKYNQANGYEEKSTFQILSREPPDAARRQGHEWEHGFGALPVSECQPET